MNIKTYLLLLIICIIVMGCKMKKNDGIADIKIKDRYEFNNRILTSPLVLEDNKKGILRLAFVNFKKKDGEDIHEVVVYNLDGKQYNNKKIEIIDAYRQVMAIEAIDRNGDGVDEILLYDIYGRDWVFDQDGNKIKGHGAYNGLDDIGVLASLDQLETTENNKKGKKIVTVTVGWGGKYDKKYLLDVSPPGKDSLKGYPIIFDEGKISKPIMAGENIYLHLSARDEFLDGYAIDGGKRLAGFPVKLHGIEYMKDMCFYKNEYILFSDGKNFISRMNLKNKKIENVEIKDSKSIENIKTGYVNGEEYIYAFDDKDNIIYKINNKNKVTDKLKVNIEDSFEFKYFNTFSINNGNETYLFFIYVEEALMDIEKMFNKYGAAAEGKKIEEEVYSDYKNFYKTQKLNVEQMKEAKERVIEFKNDYLRKHLGGEKYSSIRVLTPQTKIIVYRNTKDKIEHISLEEVSEYVFDMFFVDYPELCPKIYFNATINTLAFIVALNKESEDEENEKSIIKSYIFNDIK